MEAVAIIPARMGSSRFPGKPLAPILGRPMIEHVVRRTALCPDLAEVFVATCDEEIRRAVETFGGKVIMTSPRHQRASDRTAEAAESVNARIVVMVQGDEPMIRPEMVSAALAPFRTDPSVRCVNLAAPIQSEKEHDDPNTIKAVMNQKGDALYFSREPIPTRRMLGFPSLRVFKQVCVIPFVRTFLLEYARLSMTPLEQAESIDMLRLLEHGFPIRLVEIAGPSHSVDTPQDLARVEELLRKDPLAAWALETRRGEAHR